MKATRASVEIIAKQLGYEPVNIDGIPEGFSYKIPDLTIGGFTHLGEYIAMIPLSEDVSIRAKTPEDLLIQYKQLTK